jgi:hypothetical protein
MIDSMRWRVLVWVGVLAVAIGFVWTLQGLGYLGGSVMTDDRLWAVVGPIVAVGGAALAIIGIRRGGRS